MVAAKKQHVLVSGASIAGLSTAFWLNRAGYRVTVVEQANEPRSGGAAVNVEGSALNTARRMGLLESFRTHALRLEQWEFKNADDVTEGSFRLPSGDVRPCVSDEIEIERDILIRLLFDAVKGNVEFVFQDRITALHEGEDRVEVTFQNGSRRSFDLVFGCDGLHSGVRHLWFGHEAEYSHFLGAYFSLTIVNKLLIPQKTAQLYNVPGKLILLNAYKNKTDIVFCFHSPHEIAYDYRGTDRLQEIILEQFAGQGWRSAELRDEVRKSKLATVYRGSSRDCPDRAQRFSRPPNRRCDSQTKRANNALFVLIFLFQESGFITARSFR